ncbi:type VI secretion system tube protein TssD [Lacinutrix mariniflava]|uniref:type VI secretion system tube protein TssD n=1 Tax=Lacinutrix mariniflava TaxID=342955 RepID=UPI0006E4019A|nr:type VI secretion system tube protein TssD [Lacinutrix mariniflava]
MSFIAKLEVDGETFNILKAEYYVKQSIDSRGAPDGRPQGGQIDLLIESTIDVDFFDWAAQSKETKDGKVTFFKRDNISSFKILEFKEAYCIEFREIFDAENTDPLKCKVVISSRELIVRGTKFTNNWPRKQ